jgi:hypothetical protein
MNQYTIPQLVEENDEHIIYDIGSELTPQDYETHKKYHSIVTRFYYGKRDKAATVVTTYEEEGEHLPLAISNRLIPLALWQAITGHIFKTDEEIKAEAEAKAKLLASLRNVVVEHEIVSNSTGASLPAVVLDGKDWGEDFDNLASPHPETPIGYVHNDGFNKEANCEVTYTQTFIRTARTNEQLLQEYK